MRIHLGRTGSRGVGGIGWMSDAGAHAQVRLCAHAVRRARGRTRRRLHWAASAARRSSVARCTASVAHPRGWDFLQRRRRESGERSAVAQQQQQRRAAPRARRPTRRVRLARRWRGARRRRRGARRRWRVAELRSCAAAVAWWRESGGGRWRSAEGGSAEGGSAEGGCTRARVGVVVASSSMSTGGGRWCGSVVSGASAR